MPDLRGLAGAVLCAGFPGAAPDPAILDELRDLAPAALVLFARNVSDLDGTRALVAAARTAAGGDAPALACIDQEGGRVLRLRFGGELPSMLALGATGDEALAERAGARLAAELRAVGVNVDFAPVLDLALAADSTVIGTRSLGDDPGRVARLGTAIVRGMQSAGVVATVKHFPGHGATAVDSHTALPSVTADRATLVRRELVPFASAFAGGAEATMTAHIVVTALDDERPATLSFRVLGGLLRDELGFEGACFTDCLQMAAIAETVGTARGAVLALAAGADCAVVSHDLALARGVRDALVAAVENGELPFSRLVEAASRLDRLRHTFAPAEPLPEYPGDDGLARAIASRAIVRVRGNASLARDRPVTIVSFEGEAGDGIAGAAAERPSLSLALRRRRFRSELLRVAVAPDDAMREMLLEVLRAQGDRDVVIVARRAHRSSEQRAAIAELLALAPNAIGVSALEPFDAGAFADAKTVFCTFGDDESNVEALADVLAGLHDATGSLPVHLA